MTSLDVTSLVTGDNVRCDQVHTYYAGKKTAPSPTVTRKASRTENFSAEKINITFYLLFITSSQNTIPFHPEFIHAAIIIIASTLEETTLNASSHIISLPVPTTMVHGACLPPYAAITSTVQNIKPIRCQLDQF